MNRSSKIYYSLLLDSRKQQIVVYKFEIVIKVALENCVQASLLSEWTKRGPTTTNSSFYNLSYSLWTRIISTAERKWNWEGAMLFQIYGTHPLNLSKGSDARSVGWFYCGHLFVSVWCFYIVNYPHDWFPL